jgi:hypothetical protein
MTDSQVWSFIAPFFMLAVAVIVGFIAKAILKRIPEGRVKRILSYPPDESSKEPPK